MKVWRVRDNNTEKFLHGMYPIQGIANTYMIKLAEGEMKKNHRPVKEAWANVSKDYVYENNKYRHEELGIDWETVEVDFITDEDYRRWKEQKEAEDDYEWHDLEESQLLVDGEYYDVELVDGSAFSSVLYDEDNVLFHLDDNDIQVEEISAFRRCY